jgi:iron complex transport system substrate-binding protein
MIFDMGLHDILSGVTFDCHAAAVGEKPKLVQCILEGNNDTSADHLLNASTALYHPQIFAIPAASRINAFM